MSVIIVGAGLGGLLAGAELTRRGVNVTVLESSDVVGGVATTHDLDGYRLEPAVGSLMLPHPALTPIVEAADIEVIEHRGSTRRLASDGDGWFELPSSPGSFLKTKAIGLPAKLRVLVEPRISSRTTPDESLTGFLTRRFGSEAGAYAAGLAATGVFGGDPQHIDAAAFAPLIGLEASYGSVLGGIAKRRKQAGSGSTTRPTIHFPMGGMHAFAEGLANYIGDVRLETLARAIRPSSGGAEVDGEWADAVIVTCPPTNAPHMSGTPLPLESPPLLEVSVVFLGGTPDEMQVPNGFGLLTTYRADTSILGVLLESGPGSAPPGRQLVKCLVGGSKSDTTDWSDDQILSTTHRDLEKLIGSSIRPSFVHVVRRLIPQYPPGHIRRVRASTWPEHVFGGGWTQRGIGLGSLAADAVRLANHISPIDAEGARPESSQHQQ